MLSEILDHARLRGVRSALDLGTGTGQSLEVVQSTFPDAELWGVDTSAGMLQKAAARVPTAHLEVGDIVSHIAGQSRSFDLITAIGCLESVPNLAEVLSRIAAKLGDGGWFALTFTPLMAGFDGHDRSEYWLGDGTRTYYNWSTAEPIAELPGCNLVASRLFKAYERLGVPVVYELLLLLLHLPART